MKHLNTFLRCSVEARPLVPKTDTRTILGCKTENFRILRLRGTQSVNDSTSQGLKLTPLFPSMSYQRKDLL